MNTELIAKAKEAKSPEELMALAKENGMELTEEAASTYFQVHILISSTQKWASLQMTSLTMLPAAAATQAADV